MDIALHLVVFVIAQLRQSHIRDVSHLRALLELNIAYVLQTVIWTLMYNKLHPRLPLIKKNRCS